MSATSYLDNYYARLGVSRTANLEEIHQAYRSAARRFHPDANKITGAHELFLLLQEAYDTLSDSEKRFAYDRLLPADVDTPPSILVNALYSRNQITPGEGDQVIYVLLDLAASGSVVLDRPPLNISLVLDTSTSMAGSRLDQVVKAATHFLDQVRPDDFISVVTFNDRAELIIPAQSGLDTRHSQARIYSLQTRGGTEILSGLQLGVQQVQRNFRPDRTNHLVLITDGRTYGDETACLHLAAQTSNLGLPISVIGIGEEWNEDFVDQLVSKSGGSSLYADHSTEISSLLKKRLKSLTQCFANNVKLYFEAGPETSLHYAFRFSPELGALPMESPIFLGAIPNQTSLSVILEFQVDAHRLKKGEVMLAEGELRLDIPSNAIPAAKTRFRLIRPVKESADTDAPSQTLINAIGKLSLFRMQEQARREIEEGDLEGAARRMRMLATHLLSKGQKGLAQTVLLAAQDIKDEGALGVKTGKQIKYGTRSLITEFES